jgi:putative addiction module component (TIGR02574 family)
MPPTVQSLGIDRLSREQRIELVQEIWDTIAAESLPATLTEAERLELQRRVDEDNASPDDVVPWEQVKAQTLGRLKP